MGVCYYCLPKAGVTGALNMARFVDLFKGVLLKSARSVHKAVPRFDNFPKVTVVKFGRGDYKNFTP